MPKVSGTARIVVKSALSQNFHELIRRRERADRRRQVAVGARCAARPARPMRGRTRLKYQQIARARTRGVGRDRRTRESRAGRPARSTRCISRHATAVLLDVADAEGDRRPHRPTRRHRNPRRVAAHERDRGRRAARAQLLAPDAQHRAGEIDADDTRGAAAAPRAPRSRGRRCRCTDRARARARSAAATRIARVRQRRSMPALRR